MSAVAYTSGCPGCAYERAASDDNVPHDSACARRIVAADGRMAGEPANGIEQRDRELYVGAFPGVVLVHEPGGTVHRVLVKPGESVTLTISARGHVYVERTAENVAVLGGEL